jgi:quinol monooxygenase YgiN
VNLVSGYLRVSDGDVDRLRGAIANQCYAAQRIEGCEQYNFAVDVLDLDLLWVSEVWSDPDAMALHLVSDHMVEFNIGMRRAKVMRAEVDAFDPDGTVRRLINVGTDLKSKRTENMIIVMGHATFEEGEIDRLQSEMETQIAATRAEEGCELYVFARDVLEPDTLRITERWRDRAALDAHFETPHMIAFNAVIGAAKLIEISVKAYENGGARTLMGE